MSPPPKFVKNEQVIVGRDSELDSIRAFVGSNDGDGLEDYSSINNAFPIDPLRRDPGCSSPLDDDERGSNACDDGLDNDQDGFVDYLRFGGGEPECFSPHDETEDS